MGFQTEMPSMRSGRLPCTVTPTGRVCGTGIGIEWIQVTRLTSSSSTMPDDGAREPLPLQVRFESGQEQERAAKPVDQPVQCQLRRLVVLQVVLDEADLRAPGPVVHQLVGVELGHHLGIQGVQQFGGDLLDDVAGVGEPGKSHDEVQSAQFGAVEQRVITQVKRFGVQQGAGNPFNHGMFLSS